LNAGGTSAKILFHSADNLTLLPDIAENILPIALEDKKSIIAKIRMRLLYKSIIPIVLLNGKTSPLNALIVAKFLAPLKWLKK
jgi:hypothetical protein